MKTLAHWAYVFWLGSMLGECSLGMQPILRWFYVLLGLGLITYHEYTLSTKDE